MRRTLAFPAVALMAGILISHAGAEPRGEALIPYGPRGSSVASDADLLFEPDTVRFGNVPVGASEEMDARLINDGTETATGGFPEECDGFEILEGSGAFNLTPGSVLDLRIRFHPDRAGSYSCALRPGGNARNLVLFGYGTGPQAGEPECKTVPGLWDFRTLRVGEETWRYVYITNLSGILEGDVQVDCDQFIIARRAGPFRIGAHRAIGIQIYYKPTYVGTHECRLFTSENCDLVELVGHAVAADDTTTGPGDRIIAFDARPNQCPNRLRLESEAVFQAAILGRPDFDVAEIDPGSVRILGAIAPIRSTILDIGGLPASPGECLCPEPGRDGIPDLRLTLSAADIRERLGGRPSASFPIEVSGRLMDGTTFRGEDCLTFLGPDLQLDPVSLPGPRLRVLTGPADRVQRIEVGSPEAGATRLRIYDLSGRRVDEILGAEGTGAGVLEWDSRGVPNGIYFLRAESREGPLQGKILLVR